MHASGAPQGSEMWGAAFGPAAARCALLIEGGVRDDDQGGQGWMSWRCVAACNVLCAVCCAHSLVVSWNEECEGCEGEESE